jgi:hypothetical protein
MWGGWCNAAEERDEEKRQTKKAKGKGMEMGRRPSEDGGAVATEESSCARKGRQGGGVQFEISVVKGVERPEKLSLHVTDVRTYALRDKWSIGQGMIPNATREQEGEFCAKGLGRG